MSHESQTVTHHASAGTLRGLPGVSIEPTRRMRAEGFKWDHEIQIALPPSYHKTDKAYPVLWVTDGSNFFDTAVRTVYRHERKYLPEMIVVALGEPPEALHEHQMRRTYDFTPNSEIGFEGFGSELFKREVKAFEEAFTAAGVPVAREERGGASGFLAFLVDTVRSVLSRDYRMSDQHTLFGHSGGGLFCAYALLERPESFAKYICGSPCLNAGNHELFRMEERYAQTHQDLPAEVFFGAGEGEVLEGGAVTAWGIVSSMTRMAEILRLRAYPSLKLHVGIFPNEEHASVVPMDLSWGLRTLWKGEVQQ